MVTFMPIYIWVKGGKTSDCSPCKRRALCSTDKSLTEVHFTFSTSSQWKQSWAPCHLLSICHGPLNQCEDWLPCLQKQHCYPCMSQTWQRGMIPAFTGCMGWMPSLRVELCSPCTENLNHHSPFCSLSHFHCTVFWCKAYALCVISSSALFCK